MDLGAYLQIGTLQAIAYANNIDIPRLRGYRLMKNESVVLKEQIEDMIKDSEITIAQWLCETYPPFNPNDNSREWSYRTDMIKKYYLILNPKRHEKGNLIILVFVGIEFMERNERF